MPDDNNKIIKDLEAEKLKLEIKNLNKSAWRKPSTVLTILVPLLIIGVTYCSSSDFIRAEMDLQSAITERQVVEMKYAEDFIRAEVRQMEDSVKQHKGILDGMADSLMNQKAELMGMANALNYQKVQLNELDEQLLRTQGNYETLKENSVLLAQENEGFERDLSEASESNENLEAYIKKYKYKKRIDLFIERCERLLDRAYSLVSTPVGFVSSTGAVILDGDTFSHSNLSEYSDRFMEWESFRREIKFIEVCTITVLDPLFKDNDTLAAHAALLREYWYEHRPLLYNWDKLTNNSQRLEREGEILDAAFALNDLSLIRCKINKTTLVLECR